MRPTPQLDPVTKLLRQCACLNPDRSELAAIRETAAGGAAWSELPAEAESHGLAPLVYRHAKRARIRIPESCATALRALTLRHRCAIQIRTRVLHTLLAELQTARIQPLVLKGAALAHLIYPTPGLRPMADLDLLVEPGDADRAQAVLRKLGFSAPSAHSAYMRNHHHLPSACMDVEGLRVSVEIHRDALSGDAPGALTTRTLAELPQEFDLGGVPALTLNHADMLHHLCRHTFEPGRRTKLIGAVDTVGYAQHFAATIDWEKLRATHPFVINTLRCLYYLVPVSAALHGILPPPAAPAPSGVGSGHKTLSEIAREGLWPGRLWREIFYASDWWLHVAYAVPPESSLLAARWLRHPARVTYWYWRRLRAAATGASAGARGR